MKKAVTTYRMVASAVMIALATVLNQFAVIQLPIGGGVTVFSQVPIIMLGYIFGPAWGLVSGFIMSLTQLLFGLSNFAYVKTIVGYIVVALFDYIVPYTILGLGGIFKNRFKSAYAEITLGAVFVSFLRFLCHYFSGAFVWGEWMPETFLGLKMTSPWIYSALYNGSYMLLETIVTIIGILALARLFLPKLDENGMITN
ncbi:MAG: energy-coupled thiamine transporter ThiT [Clostridia bacterium]|nr:energy-coupled thiamine transporter ThiT [Clostridia bacterium]